MDLVWLFLSLEGRIGRGTYAAAQFGLGLAAAGLHFAAPAYPLAALVLVFPTVALMVKRLHDLGQSATLVFIPVTAAAWLIGSAARRSGHLAFKIEIQPPFEPRDWMIVAVAAVGAAFTWWLALAPGQRGPVDDRAA
jgi:uncharacterized membrane protein YhaH (DUF805 family)